MQRRESTTRCVFCKVIPEWSLRFTLRKVKGQVLLAQKASRVWFSILGMVYVRSKVTKLEAAPFIGPH